ncbi:MAG: acyloxyacyl hydrolase [Verrucomicrobiales bacterium]|nr:acyloxyacyl hydrolase [Verrucomicrobiales bacterium]
MKFATVVSLWVVTAAVTAKAEEPKSGSKVRLEMAGIRTAFSATRIDEHFYQAEAYARWALPGQLEFGRDWSLRAGIDASAGMLGRLSKEDKGFVGSLGPVLILNCARIPVDLVIGSSPTILSRDSFDGVDLGVPFQFTSHLGFNVHLSDRWSLSYRLQHMSNAGMGDRNPGLDLHSLALSFKF